MIIICYQNILFCCSENQCRHVLCVNWWFTLLVITLPETAYIEDCFLIQAFVELHHFLSESDTLGYRTAAHS